MSWDPGPAWLFCPGDRPDRFAKAFERADLVILDLEDAVSPDRKHVARAAVAAAAVDLNRCVVRVNAASSAFHEADLAVVRGMPGIRVMLAKTESAAQLAGLSDLSVIGTIESARGAHSLPEIAASPGLAGLAWGAEDLVASLGGTGNRRPDGCYRDVAREVRSRTLLAAKANGLLAVDAIHADIGDLPGLRAECEDAATSGFDATMAVHPAQVPVIRDAYTPSAAAVTRARRLLKLADGDSGVTSFEGQMVDGPTYAMPGERSAGPLAEPSKGSANFGPIIFIFNY